MRIPNGFKEKTLKEYPALQQFYKSLAEPLFLEVETPEDHARIIAKCEYNHPGETIKAKVALAMIWKLLDNLEKPTNEITVLEYSGGGLSMALSKLCYLLGIKTVLVLMDKTPTSVLDVLRGNGAEIILTDAKKYGFYGVIEKARELKKEHPEWKFLYQHENRANYHFHYHVTGEEVLDQNYESIDAWVTSIGTGGTLIGVYDSLKRKYPQLQLYTNMPKEMPYAHDGPSNALPKFSGSGGLGCGKKQKFVEEREHEVVEHYLTSFEESQEEMIDFYAKTGTFIGSSSAANLFVAKKIAKKLGKDATVLTVFQSGALKEEKKKILESLNQTAK
ncbi:cysteine synthase [Kordia sp. SMS9]|uniref:pyridoxal-phosphate dependent enzyme n=1 Tax=Kordia sp. SMS9 TaxID=2282170 RepID=UPI000E0D5305|nr:pyridoxal-phosphate dependent enzyme [Kordia sp. SMS9]AXG70223.1 cysteine synthase [Kordia sp. SMS9]